MTGRLDPHRKAEGENATRYLKRFRKELAKAAIDHMARTAAIEMAEHRVRVNVVHPGWIDTPGERKFFTEEQIEVGGKKLPWGRLGTPEEIAKAIIYTLSDDADYMTGSTLLIDGGVSLPWWSNRDDGEM